MTKTLYEQYPETCAALELRGYKAIVEMTKHFRQFSEMSRALSGTTHGSYVAKWMRGISTPEWPSEVRAQKWVDANIHRASVFPDQSQAPLPLMLENQTWMPSPPATKKPTAFMMISCPPWAIDKVIKVLSMMGCEAVEM